MKKRNISCLILIGALIISGCGNKKKNQSSQNDFSDEPTKYQSQEGLEKLTQQAQQKAAQKLTANNPQFASARDVKPSSDVLKILDSAMRPVLVKHYGSAKMTEQNNEPVTKRDGEVVINSMKYVVGKKLDEANVEALHTAFLNADFGTSPRLGSKPTVTKSWGAMSFFLHKSGITFSLALRIDMKKQIIEVESYKLGSKYDRLM